MRPAILLPFLLPVLTGLLGSCATGRGTGAASAAFAHELEARNHELEERFGAGDLLGVADLYADDAILLRPDSRTEGREAIDAYWSDITGPLNWRLEVFEVGGTPELAYQLGRSHQVRRLDNADHTQVTDFMRMWKKDAAGEWKIAVDAAW